MYKGVTPSPDRLLKKLNVFSKRKSMIFSILLEQVLLRLQLYVILASLLLPRLKVILRYARKETGFSTERKNAGFAVLSLLFIPVRKIQKRLGKPKILLF